MSNFIHFSNVRLHLSQHLIEFCLTKDPYNPRHSTVLAETIRLIRLCLSVSQLGKVVLDVPYSTTSVSRIRSIVQAPFSCRWQICRDDGRNLSRRVLLSLQSSTSVTDLLHTSPDSNTLSTLNKEISSNLLVSSHIQCFICKVPPLQILCILYAHTHNVITIYSPKIGLAD